jgi:hypothetical protein
MQIKNTVHFDTFFTVGIVISVSLGQSIILSHNTVEINLCTNGDFDLV